MDISDRTIHDMKKKLSEEQIDDCDENVVCFKFFFILLMSLALSSRTAWDEVVSASSDALDRWLPVNWVKLTSFTKALS